MHNLAEFMKTFVQRMTRFINCEQFHPNRASGARKPIGPLKLLKGKIQAYRGLQRGHYERKK